MRLIDADALISDLAHDVKMDEDSLIYEDLTNENREIIQFDKDCKQNAIDLLHHEPTIEERKTGEWVYGEDDAGQDGWTCSECGFFVPWYYDYYGLNNIDFIRDFHTCPHCDAKMLTYTGKDGGRA